MKDRINENGVISWCWKSNPSNCRLQNCLSSLVQDVESVQLHPGSDYTHCSISLDGIYRVSILKHLIDHNHVSNFSHAKTSWCKLIPIKVLGFVWRAMQGRMPCDLALIHKNIPIDFMYCGFSVNQQEDADHILIKCLFACLVREKKNLNWCGVDDMIVNTVGEFIDFTYKWGKLLQSQETIHCNMLWGAMGYLEITE